MPRRLRSVLKTAVFLLDITPVCTEVLSMTSQSKALRTTEELAVQMFLLFQVGIGTVANILLFVHNFSPIFTGSRLRPTQVIVSNLALANVFILATAFPSNMMIFVPRKPQTDFYCKIDFFIHLVARSTNMCSTCALSIHQFATLVPGNWVRVMLKGRAPNVLSYSCYSCWLFGVLNNVYIPMKVSGARSTDNDTNNNSRRVCSTSGFSVGMVILQLAHHSVFISVMAWTSVSMVLLLHKHHKRLKLLHTPNQDHRPYPEIRAAHTILMLVVTFVNFYVVDCICRLFRGSYVESHLWLRLVNEVLTEGFPTISPFLLIFRDPKDPCSVFFNC